MAGIHNMLLGGGSKTSLTIASNQTNLNLRTWALANGWAGTDPLEVTIQSGVYISSTSVGTPALTINGSFPGGVKLVNNGYVVGMGGAGGKGGDNGADTATAGGPGGTAIQVSVPVSMVNNGTIGGGGGGGGGGASLFVVSDETGGYYFGGGGGGGGQSGTTNSSGGSAGSGNYGNGTAGNAGSISGAGTGGNSGGGVQNPGAGNSYGATGFTGAASNMWFSSKPGGSGGAAVSGNANITWESTGTRLGGIS